MPGQRAWGPAAAAVLMVAALAGCADTASPAASSSRTDASSSANSGAPSPATSLVATPTTLRGTIIDNDRPTCRVLQTADGRWALVGPGVDTLRVGDTVTVTGAGQPHLVSLCGQTFVITSVQH